MRSIVISVSIRMLILLPLSIIAASCMCSRGSGDAPDATDTSTSSEPEDPRIDWLEIPSGSFTFGSPDGTPCMGPMTEKQVPVTLTHPFLMAKTEITQKQWAAMGFQVPPNTPVCDDCPVMYLTWFEALAWCNALSRFEGLEECYDLSTCMGDLGGGCPEGYGGCGGSIEAGNAYDCSGKTRRYDSMYDCTGYRLPTGPEWEYAAKAGTTTNTYNGDITDDHDGYCADEPILNDIAWYCYNTGCMDGSQPWDPNSLNLLQEVGQKQPNPFGLYDMLGNAMEWVDYVSTGFSLDWWYGATSELLVDPIGPPENEDSRRDLRGGAYYGLNCYNRTADQFQESGDHRGPGYGFRPVRTLPAIVPDAGIDGGTDGSVKRNR
jgi:formylglycine-generating enzyme